MYGIFKKQTTEKEANVVISFLFLCVHFAACEASTACKVERAHNSDRETFINFWLCGVFFVSERI